MNILMTGGSGVVGRRAIPLLVGAGHRVVATARSEASARTVGTLGAEPRMVNLFAPAEVRAALRGMDAVMNLATSIPPSKRAVLPWAWKQNSRIRMEVSVTIAAAALAEGVRTYVQESFAPIYADAGDRWIDETAPVRTTSHTHSVLAAEAAALDFASRAGSGCAGVVLRFGLFYGPDSDFTADMLRSAAKGVAMAFGEPGGYVSPLSHDDAATAVVASLGLPSGIYNVCDNQPATRREFYDALAQVAGAAAPKFPPSFLGKLFGSIGDILMRSQRISNRRFRDASGWTPAFPSIHEGLATLSAGRSEGSGAPSS